MNTAVTPRKANPSPLRRYAWLSLLGSTVVAVAAGFGGVWMARAGLVVAVAGGLMACAFAWREVRVTRTTLLAQQSADSRRSGEKLHAERVQHVRLLQVLQARNGELRSKLNTTRAEAAQLNQEAAQLRGDKVALQVELSEHRAAAEAEVLALPRRISGRDDVVDLWGVDGAPTVVELQALANPPVPESQQRKHA
ncbi:MAG TPA: hypothetical protein VGK18_07815 [Propionicimonas sp.]|uniref:hypothetical protein n=1 Tax=Propionicimonas sp. TaxID=1955623 RepID=UPI002F40F096